MTNMVLEVLKPYLMASPVATLLLISSWKMGKWLDKEADAEWREKFGKVLRDGSWFHYLQLAYSFVGTSLDKWLGARIVSLRMLVWSVAISVVSTIFVCVYVWVNTDDNTSQSYITLFFVRIGPATFVDFLTLIRVRFLCREKLPARFLLVSAPLSVLCDLASILGTALLCDVVAGLALSFGLNIPLGGVADGIVGGFVEHYDHLFVIFMAGAGAIIPALIFYVFTFALIVTRLLVVVLFPVKNISGHLMFREPFVVIGTVVGGLLASLVVCVGWVAHQFS